MLSSEKIRQYAIDAGFSLCGIALVRALGEQSARITDWLDKGYDSGLGYMRRNIDKRLDPAILVQGAKSVIICAAAYKNHCWDQRHSVNPKVSSYALSTDYHITLKGMLRNVWEKIKADHPEISGRCFTDSAPVLEKSWAIEAGLGWRGKNSLIVTPHFGSFVFLGEIIMDASVDSYDKPYDRDGCGNCTACIEACPTSAIRAPYVIETGRCISRLTTEKLPEGYEFSTTDTHGWIYGCDICQSVCPHNSRTPLTDMSAFVPRFDPSGSGKEFWQALDRQTFMDLFGNTPMARTGFETIKARATKFFETKQ